MSLFAKFAIFSILVFVLIATLGLLFYARPAPVLGIGGDSLNHSVDKAESSTPCRQSVDGDWVCRITGDGPPTTYLVDTRWDGCWEGTRTAGPVSAYAPQNISGCIDIWDHLRLEDVLK